MKVTEEAAWDHSVVESRAARFLHRNLLEFLSVVVGWCTKSGDVCVTVSVTFKICKSSIGHIEAFTEIRGVCLCQRSVSWTRRLQRTGVLALE